VIQRLAGHVARGFAMGAADVVPGVSGGTVALLVGIYDDLIAEIRTGAGSLARFLRGDLRGGVERLRSVDWPFLASLLLGIGTAVVVLVGWLRTQIDEHPVQVSAVFFGMIVASVVVARGEVGRWDGPRLATLAGVAAISFVALGFRTGGVDDPSALVIVGAGALAICAMILPGVSGSFILLMLGLYDHVTEAVDDRDLGTVLAFGVGAVVGLALFSTVLHWLLAHHRDTVLAALIGLMLGSLRVLWPWPSGEEGLDNVSLARPVSGELFGALIGAVVAGVAVVVITSLASRTETKEGVST
jgi:putative membrane protein